VAPERQVADLGGPAHAGITPPISIAASQALNIITQVV
jgi:hypothetical protein